MGSNTYYYHLDHLGSLSIATDGSGSRVQAVTYYPYGEVRTNYGAVDGSAPAFDLPYKFTGHELDSETGLYYCGATYYDASQGRFLTPDTIVQSPGDPQTLNRYAYARNNPLAFVDPTGHGFLDFFEDFIAGFIGAAVTALTGGAGSPVACMLGGMVAGASDAAMHGASLVGIVQSGFLGGVMGGIGGGLYTAGVPWPVMAGAGAAIAGGTGGVRGLEHLAAGVAGGLVGGALGGYLNKAIDSNMTQAADYQSNVSQLNKTYQKVFNAQPNDDVYADTRVTLSGDIVVTHYDRYYELDPSCQYCVDAHENVHVGQFQPYAIPGYGYFSSRIAYSSNWAQWELPAYKAQYDCLSNALATATPSTPRWAAIYDEMSRVGWNIHELKSIINNQQM